MTRTNRRTFIATGGVLLAGIAGCSSTTSTDTEEEPKVITGVDTVVNEDSFGTTLEVQLQPDHSGDEITLEAPNGQEYRRTQVSVNQTTGRLLVSSPSATVPFDTYSVVLYRDGEIVDRREWTANQTTLPEGNTGNSS
jgi:hypothetical protein